LPFRSEEPKGKFSSLQSLEKSQNGEGISPEPREENNPYGTGSSKTRGSAEIISPAAGAATTGVSFAWGRRKAAIRRGLRDMGR
jgi:hypothetical protein